jgi:hypothetical protein
MSLYLKVVVLEAASNLCFGFPSLSLVNVIHVYIHGWLSENFQNHRSAFGTTSEIRQLPRKAGTSFLKRVTGRILN